MNYVALSDKVVLSEVEVRSQDTEKRDTFSMDNQEMKQEMMQETNQEMVQEINQEMNQKAAVEVNSSVTQVNQDTVLVTSPRKIFSRLGWSYLAGTVVVYGLQLIVGLLLERYQPQWQTNTNILLILSEIIVYGCGMPFIWFLVSGMKKTIPERHRMRWWEFLVGFIICYALVYVSNLVGTLCTFAIGTVKGEPVQNGLVEYVTNGNLLLNFVLMVVIAPIVEELVFRKVIVDRTLAYGQWVAIVISGLMFGLFHGNLNQFAYAVVLGMFFAFLYIKTGNLKVTIGMHAIINFVGGILSGLLLKGLHYDEFLELNTAGDTEAMMSLMMEHIGAWLGFALYAFLLFVVVISGIILLIVFHKKFRLEHVVREIPEGQRFRAVFCNFGMIAFCITWIVLIVLQLLA